MRASAGQIAQYAQLVNNHSTPSFLNSWEYAPSQPLVSWAGTWWTIRQPYPDLLVTLTLLPSEVKRNENIQLELIYSKLTWLWSNLAEQVNKQREGLESSPAFQVNDQQVWEAWRGLAAAGECWKSFSNPSLGRRVKGNWALSFAQNGSWLHHLSYLEISRESQRWQRTGHSNLRGVFMTLEAPFTGSI